MFDQISALKAKGVRIVYVDVWNQGITYFESATMRKLVGQTGIGADHLSRALEAGNHLQSNIFIYSIYISNMFLNVVLVYFIPLS